MDEANQCAIETREMNCVLLLLKEDTCVLVITQVLLIQCCECRAVMQVKKLYSNLTSEKKDVFESMVKLWRIAT